MNSAQTHNPISAPRDGALDKTHRAALASHVTQCVTCRRVQQGFAAAIDGWCTEIRQTCVPDADLEWQKLRREIRGGAGSKAAATASKRSPLTWFAIPLAAAATLTIAIVMNSGSSDPVTPTQSVARAGTAS